MKDYQLEQANAAMRELTTRIEALERQTEANREEMRVLQTGLLDAQAENGMLRGLNKRLAQACRDKNDENEHLRGELAARGKP